MEKLSSPEVVERFHPELTARKLELWVNNEYVHPERGGPGRGGGHKFPPREVRKIELMIGIMRTRNLDPKAAAAEADAELLMEDRPVILAVEPDPLQQRLLSAFLSSAYKVQFVDSAQRAAGILRLRDEAVALVILEPRLEVHAAALLIEEAHRQSVPVIVTTSASAAGTLPAKTTLIKPFQYSKLEKAARDLLPVQAAADATADAPTEAV